MSIFKNARVVREVRWPEGAPGPAGQVLTMDFELEGQRFIALNGGPACRVHPGDFTAGVVLHQDEVDALWEKLLAGGGRESQCGWLQDRFGLSWQIIPTALMTLMSDPDPKNRVASHCDAEDEENQHRGT